MIDNAQALADIAAQLDGEAFLDRIGEGLESPEITETDFCRRVLAVAARTGCSPSYLIAPHFTLAQSIRAFAAGTDDPARVLLLAVIETPALTSEGLIWLLRTGTGR